jgi:hypothetical protein
MNFPEGSFCQPPVMIAFALHGVVVPRRPMPLRALWLSLCAVPSPADMMEDPVVFGQ